MEYIYKKLATPNSGLDYYLELTPMLSPASWTNDGYTAVDGPVVGDYQDVTNSVPLTTDAKFIKLIIEQE